MNQCSHLIFIFSLVFHWSVFTLTYYLYLSSTSFYYFPIVVNPFSLIISSFPSSHKKTLDVLKSCYDRTINITSLQVQNCLEKLESLPDIPKLTESLPNLKLPLTPLYFAKKNFGTTSLRLIPSRFG